jgi:hypothetical protein
LFHPFVWLISVKDLGLRPTQSFGTSLGRSGQQDLLDIGKCIYETMRNRPFEEGWKVQAGFSATPLC